MNYHRISGGGYAKASATNFTGECIFYYKPDAIYIPVLNIIQIKQAQPQ